LQKGKPNVRFARVRLANGLQLHYADEGDIDGHVILLLHGWPDSWYTFSRLLKLLPRSIRSIAVDLRGFGESDSPEESYEIRDFAEDVVSFMDALSIERASIVGHSMGSFVARSVALSHPHKVDRLVLIGSGLSSGSPALEEAQAVVANLEDPVPEDFVREFQSGSAYVPLPDPFFRGVVSESLKAPARVWRSAIDGLLRYDDSSDLKQIDVPTLLIWGDKDAVFESEEEQKRLAAAIPCADLRVYADTGHCPNWERPERVAEDIAFFIKATTSL
jgi:pimeloyl-ACP methyl ester carboxylesterase